MKAIQQFIFEASGKPSDLKKYKKSEHKENVHFIGGDIYDFKDPGYDEKFTYYSGEGNGYIKDKSGKVYDVITRDEQGDAGRIAGGSHDYYVTIKKANGKDDFCVHGYTAVFSSGHNVNCISDIKAGYYLEDYILKYGGDSDPKFKDIAANGDKDAKSYDQGQADKKAQKEIDFFERYIRLPETLSFEINDKGFDFTWWRLEPSSKKKLEEEKQAWIKSTGKNSWDKELQEDETYKKFQENISNLQKDFNELMFSILKPVLQQRIQEIFKTQDINSLKGIAGSFGYKGKYVNVAKPGKGYKSGYACIAVDTKKKNIVVIDTENKKVIENDLQLILNDAITFDKTKASDKMLKLMETVAKAWKKTEGKKQTQYVSNHWEDIWQSGRGMYPWNPDKYTKSEAKQIAKDEFIKMVNKHDFDRNNQIAFSLQLIQGYIEGDLNPEEKEVENPLENPEPTKEKTERGKDTKLSKGTKSAAYDKMKAWHEGTRKQNLSSCSDAKLQLNYKVCKELGYDKEMDLIKQEADKRNLTLENKISLEDYVSINEDENEE